jgi:BlaI family transcriptional regulator, penicillinase repressor
MYPKKSQRLNTGLSRRERQVMSAVYSKKGASANELLAGIPDPPSYSAVRSILYILEAKGLLRHRKAGRKHVYFPTVPREEARETALTHLIKTYFDDSVEKAVSAILETRGENLTEDELGSLSRLIDEFLKGGKG